MSQASGFPQVVESKITNPRAASIDQDQSLKGSIVGDAYLKLNEGKGGAPGPALAAQKTADGKPGAQGKQETVFD